MPRGELRAEVLALLPWGRKTRRPRSADTDRHGLIPNAVSIEERSVEASERLVPGHWEGDLIKGTRNQSRIGTLVERKALYNVLAQLDNASAEHTAQRFDFVLNRLDTVMRLSMTNDIGKEMAHHQVLTQSTGIKVFFAHPYSPWERASTRTPTACCAACCPEAMTCASTPRGSSKPLPFTTTQNPASPWAGSRLPSCSYPGARSTSRRIGLSSSAPLHLGLETALS